MSRNFQIYPSPALSNHLQPGQQKTALHLASITIALSLISGSSTFICIALPIIISYTIKINQLWLPFPSSQLQVLLILQMRSTPPPDLQSSPCAVLICAERRPPLLTRFHLQSWLCAATTPSGLLWCKHS